MRIRRIDALWGSRWKLMVAGVAATFMACGPESSVIEGSPDAVQQAASACSFTVTTNCGTGSTGDGLTATVRSWSDAPPRTWRGEPPCRKRLEGSSRSSGPAASWS